MSEREERLHDALAVSSSFYGVLATVFSGEPTGKVIARLKEDLAKLGGMRDGWDEPALWEKADAFAKSLKKLGIREAARDYAGLFAGARKGSLCPSESTYMDGTLYGPSTLRVMDIYQEAGFEKEPSFKEPDDHVSVEFVFRFLSGLDLAKRMDQDGAITADLRAEGDFVRDHLAPWIPRFAEKVEGAADTAFYKAGAALADALVRADLALHERILRPKGE